MDYDRHKIEAAIAAHQKQLIVFYYSILGGMGAVYAVFVLILSPSSPEAVTEGREAIEIIVPLLNIAVVGAASVLFRQRIKAAVTADTIARKIAAHRTGWIIRSAMLEALAILDAIAFYAVRAMEFEVMFLLVALLYVISAYPGADKLKKEMGL